MSVQSLFARMSRLVLDHSLKSMELPSGKRQNRASLLPRKASSKRRSSRRDHLLQSETLETRTLLAAPVISQGNNAINITINEDAYRNPTNNTDTNLSDMTHGDNGTLQYADGDPIYFGVILEDPNNAGTYRKYPVPLYFFSATDADGDNISWELPNGSNPSPDGDSSRAFRIIEQGDRSFNLDDDYAEIIGFSNGRYVWGVATLGTDRAALIVNDHSDYGFDGSGPGSFYSSSTDPLDFFTSSVFDDFDSLSSNTDVDGDIYTGTDSDDGGDFNYENDSSISVTVVARTGTETDSIVVNVNLRDFNDAPFIPVDFDSPANGGDGINVFYISERIGQGEFVGDLITWDEDNSPKTEQNNSNRDDPIQHYEIVNSPQLNGVNLFEISQNTGEISINSEIDVNLSVAEAMLEAYFDYETIGNRADAFGDGYVFMDFYRFIEDNVQDDWYLPLKIRVTDFRNLSDPPFDGRFNLHSRDTNVYIGILDASEFEPVIPENQLTLSVNENTPSNDIANRLLGIVTPDTHVVEVGNVVTSGDGDRDQFYTFQIDQATNPGGAFIVVPQVDPVSGLAKSAEIRVGNPDAIDFETLSTFSLVLIVTDVGLDSLSTRATITINVDDLNEATSLPNSTFTLNENTAAGALVGTVNATDIDVLTAVIDYQVISGNRAVILIDAENEARYEAYISQNLVPGDTITFKDIFTLDTVTGVLRVSQNINDDYIINGVPVIGEDLSGVDPSDFLDFEVTPTFNLTLRATDSGNPNPGFSSDEANITINLVDVIESSPTVDDAAFIINENVPNGTLVGTIIGNPGQDSIQPIIYSIIGGNVGNAFSINPNNGQLRVNNMTQLDFETQPEFTLTVQVTDSSNAASFDNGTVVITLNDVSEPVTIPDGQVFDVDENSPPGTVVGTVLFNEPDNGQTNIWQILGGNLGNTFAIDSDGIITVATNNELDFEANPQFSLIVKVTDSGTPAFSDSSFVTINLNNIEPEPPIIDDQTVTLDEFSAAGTSVTTVVPDILAPGQTVTFAIISGDPTGAFAIDEDTGEITVVDPLLDFDDSPTFNLIVESTDNRVVPLSDTAIITVNLNNLDFAPIVADQSFGLLASTMDPASIGFIVATDVDDEDTLTYTASNYSTVGVFAVDPATGEITLDDDTNLPAAGGSVTFDILVNDGNPGTPNATAQITILIHEPNVQPNIDDATFDVEERSPVGTVVGTIPVTDANLSQTHVFTFTFGNELGGFAIDSSGEITVADASVIDFSRNQIFTLTVEVVDDGFPVLSDTATVTINVLEFNGPINMSDQEQLLLEMINRARLDPLAEAARLGLDEAQTTAFVSLGTDAVQALAANQFLTNASGDHSEDMFARNFFSHVNPDGDSYDVRAYDAGYDWNALAENIEELSNNIGMDQAAIQQLFDQMILDTVNRLNLLDGINREFGAGIRDDVGLNATVMTNLLAREDATGSFITGVVFRDAADGSATDDEFYSIGEAVRSGTIRARNQANGDIYEREIGTSGAFSLRLPNGTYDIIAFGGELGSKTYVVNNVVVDDLNVKVDFEISTATELPKTSEIVGFVNGNWWVSSQSSGPWESTRWAQWPVSTLIDSVTGDFNGDGVDDIAGWAPNGYWYVGIAQPNGTFTTSKWTKWRTNDVKEIHVGDFNGDGKDDIVGLFKRGANKGDWWVAESTGSGFVAHKFGTFGSYSGIDTVLIGDFDGTGLDDIAVMTATGQWWTYLSQGNTSNVSLWTRWNVTSGVDNILVGDFDGNGADDIAGLFGTGSSRNWWVGLSTGSQFSNGKWDTWSVPSTLDHVLAGDFNGDGATDIAGVIDGNTLRVAIAGQNQFSSSTWAQLPPGLGALTDVNVGDSNGDGMADIFGRASDGWWYTAESYGSSFDLDRIVKWSATANWQHVHIANVDGRVPLAPPALPYSPASPSLVYAPTSSESAKDEENAKQQSIAARSVAVSGSSSSDDTNSSSSDDSSKKDQETQQSSSDSTSEFEAFGDSDLLDLLHQV